MTKAFSGTVCGYRRGDAFVASLRDDRSVWIDGERVADVTSDPRFRGAALSLADLYEIQGLPDMVGKMTYESAPGTRVGLSHIQPKSEADLRSRHVMIKTWMDRSGGMMGRTPDFLNVMVAAFSAGSHYFEVGGKQFAENIRRYHEFIRDNDLALTHSLVTPDVDKSKTMFDQPGNVAMRVVRESDAGIYVSGARSVATLAPLANEILVLPSPSKFPLVKEAEAYAVGFAAPARTEGMKMICRPSLAISGAVANNPLSARMDEMDAVVWFDNAFIPWERVFIYRNLEAVANVRKAGGGQAMHQSSIRSLAKAEFLLGIALALVDAGKLEGFQHVMVMVSEIVTTVEMIRGLIRASEADCLKGPSGTVLPSDEPLLVIRQMFPAQHARMMEILQLIGSGNLVVAPSIAEIESEAGAAVSTYCAGVNLSADRKIALLRLAWDASCSSFAGRQNLYEKFFAGDPWRNSIARGQGYRHGNELKDRIWSFIDRNEEWDAALAH